MIPFRASRAKIARATEHLEALKADVGAYVARNPITLKIWQHELPDYVGWSLQSSEAPPDRWSAIVGDLVHNLRTSLDLLAGELVRMNGGDDKSVYFPFCNSEAELDDTIKRRNFHGASSEAIDLVRRLKPYKGGNAMIRYVHDLDIMDKHQMLFPSASLTRVPGGRTGHYLVHVSEGEFDSGWTLKEFAQVDGADVLQASLPNIELPAIFKLVFPFNGPMREVELIPALRNIINDFSRIIDAFEALGGTVLNPRVPSFDPRSFL